MSTGYSSGSKTSNSNLVNIKPNLGFSFTNNVNVYDIISTGYELLTATDKVSISDTSISVASTESYENNLCLLLNSYTLEDTTKSIYKASYEINFNLPESNFGPSTTLTQWEIDNQTASFMNNYFSKNSNPGSSTPISLYMVLFNNSQYYSYSITSDNFSFQINPLTTLENSAETITSTPSTSPVDSLTDYATAEMFGVFFIVGGKDSTGAPVDTIYYNAGNGWVLSSVTLSVAVSNPLAVATETLRSLIVIGGEIAGGTLTDTINGFFIDYSYDSETGSETFSSLSNTTTTADTPLPASKGGQAFFVEYDYSYYLIVAGINTGDAVSNVIYCTSFDQYDMQFTFYDLTATLPFTGNFVSTSIVQNLLSSSGSGFFLGNVNDVMTLCYLYLTTNSNGSGDLLGAIESTPITGAMANIGTNSSLKIEASPNNSTDSNNSVFYLVFMGEADSTTNLYNAYVSELTLPAIISSPFTNLSITLGNWSKIITPISTSVTNLSWSVDLYNNGITAYNNLETINLNISSSKTFYFTPDSNLNPFTTPPTNYYFIGSMFVLNFITDNSAPISDVDVVNNALYDGNLNNISPYRANNYSFNTQDIFESVMEVHSGTPPSFTLKYSYNSSNSETGSFSINRLALINAQLSGAETTESMSTTNGLTIYSIINGLVPGMTINSINARIQSTGLPPSSEPVNIIYD